MPYQLQITPSAGKSWTSAVGKPLVKIGRAPHCDVVIDDPLVNDQRLSHALLKSGDRVRVGLSEIVLVEVPGEESAPDRSSRTPRRSEPEPGRSRVPGSGEREGKREGKRLKSVKAPATELPKLPAPEPSPRGCAPRPRAGRS